MLSSEDKAPEQKSSTRNKSSNTENEETIATRSTCQKVKMAEGDKFHLSQAVL